MLPAHTLELPTTHLVRNQGDTPTGVVLGLHSLVGVDVRRMDVDSVGQSLIRCIKCMADHRSILVTRNITDREKLREIHVQTTVQKRARHERRYLLFRLIAAAFQRRRRVSRLKIS